MKVIGDIFEEQPHQWGLRGDLHMWEELKNSLGALKENLSQIEFEEELDKRFNEIVQQKGKQTSVKTVWFASFPKIGMSGGSISLIWWRETGLPLIKNRYSEFNK